MTPFHAAVLQAYVATCSQTTPVQVQVLPVALLRVTCGFKQRFRLTPRSHAAVLVALMDHWPHTIRVDKHVQVYTMQAVLCWAAAFRY
jgi:hypothetical protein